MISEEAMAVAKKLEEQKDAEAKERREEYQFITRHGICPVCAVVMVEKKCGFLWGCLSYICPKCGKRLDTYSHDSF